MDPSRVKHVILDRDGVLNEEAPNEGYIRSPEEWRWIPGALEALSLMSRGPGFAFRWRPTSPGSGAGL